MTLADERLKGIDDPSLTEDRRALLRCGVAADLIHAGQFEAAREALGGLWPGIGQRPEVNNLSPEVAAEVLLQCGTLTGWIGGVRNVAGAQDRAKDLLSEALRAFQSQGQDKKASEAQYELGLCYRRVGSYDEARVMLSEALSPLTDADTELKAKILIRRSAVELCENRLYEALSILKEAEPVFTSGDDALKGRWHGHMGLVLIRLASTGGDVYYSDRAIMEFTAAIYHYERAGHDRYCGNNLNNLGMLLYKVGRYPDAHEHLDRAQAIFTRLKDPGNLAQVDETRARVLIAEWKLREADRIIAGVIETFEQGGASGYLADALAVQGVIQARVGDFETSIKTIGRAVSVAEQSGALVSAGLAALTLIEEHGASNRLTLEEIHRAYLRADKLLKDTQDVEDVVRLRACARIVMRRLAEVRLGDKDFSFYSAVNEFEAKLIGRALDEAGGSVTRAAKLLGLRHQTLTAILESRHKKLLSKRTPAEKRRRSIIKEKGARISQASLTILYAEDDKAVADAVAEAFAREGWKVEIRADGLAALGLIEGQTHFDLLLIDNELPDVSGIPLVRRARQIPHRKATPIIVTSADDVEYSAREAGADLFLRKPGGLRSLVESVRELISQGREG